MPSGTELHFGAHRTGYNSPEFPARLGPSTLTRPTDAPSDFIPLRPTSQRRSTYFEQYGTSKPRSDTVFTLGKPGGPSTSREGQAWMPDPRRSVSASAVLSSKSRPPSPLLKSAAYSGEKKSRLPAPPPTFNPKAIAIGLSLAAAMTGGDELLVSPSDMRRSARPVRTGVSTSSTLLAPASALASPTGRNVPLQASTSRQPEAQAHPKESEEERRQRKDLQRAKRRAARETERTRLWAEEMAKYQTAPRHGESPEVTDGLAEDDNDTAEAVQRDALGSVSTSLMDSFISELNSGPDDLVQRPLTPLSPWEAYAEKSKSRSSSRNRSATRRNSIAEPDNPLSLTTAHDPGSSSKQLGVPASDSVSRRASLRSTASSQGSTVPSISDVVVAHSPSLLSASGRGSPRRPIPTIDEIVNKHAGATHAAQEAVRQSIIRTASPATLKTSSPRSSSRSDAIVNVVPPRCSSLEIETSRKSSESIISDVEANRALLEQLAAQADEKCTAPVSTPTRPTTLLRNPSSRSSPNSKASFRRRSSTRQAQSFPPSLSQTPTDPATHSLALYLRSPRLTRMITVPGSPPLNVSLAEVGAQDGKAVFIFLGLGAVRYLIALFDELASALGLRLICIDRWGLGKTDDVPQGRRGLLEWARVVEHVADELNIKRFSLLGHSAGAPYALATALRLGERIHGPIHLLSPWVSSDVDGGYKWLKWVQNGMIKTAQAAEWRLQGWALGKPPPLTYHPIGFDASAPVMSNACADDSFEDLAIFDGRFDGEHMPPAVRTPVLGKKLSRVFGYGNLKEREELPASPQQPLRGQRDVPQLGMSPAQGAGSFGSASLSRNSTPSLCQRRTEPDETFEAFAQRIGGTIQRSTSNSSRSSGRTDASRKTSRHLAVSRLEVADFDGAAFGTALLQASHAESLSGGTADLMAILGRDSRPWGFSYTDVQQPCKIWYGADDDKISEKSMRWCERCMDAELRIVAGEGHNLMTSSRVMLEVLESLADA